MTLLRDVDRLRDFKSALETQEEIIKDGFSSFINLGEYLHDNGLIDEGIHEKITEINAVLDKSNSAFQYTLTRIASDIEAMAAETEEISSTASTALNDLLSIDPSTYEG